MAMGDSTPPITFDLLTCHTCQTATAPVSPLLLVVPPLHPQVDGQWGGPVDNSLAE